MYKKGLHEIMLLPDCKFCAANQFLPLTGSPLYDYLGRIAAVKEKADRIFFTSSTLDDCTVPLVPLLTAVQKTADKDSLPSSILIPSLIEHKIF